jgi:prepilin-type processing-associated H-X9-DG protein
MGILMPTLGSARSQSKAVVCKSNLSQLVLANTGYATENDGYYVSAAEDMWNNSGLHRWHGVRNALDEPFDPLKGPLVSYLADGKVKECPERVKFIKTDDWFGSFEKGCGGYGYNMTYIGSRFGQAGIEFKESYEQTARMSHIKRTAETLMFADSAMANNGQNLIEYSFAEPPFTVYNGQPITGFYMSPSIHFRHRNKANIAWVDGHISSEVMAKFDEKNAYLVMSANLLLGWFGPLDNSLFDLQ